MAPSLSSELSSDERALLLRLARASIEAGLDGGVGPLVPLLAGDGDGDGDGDGMPERLRRRAAAFVTVTVDGRLNGCIGSLEALEPLAIAVPRKAWEAAFTDPRLPPLGRGDLPGLGIKVSVLSPLEPVPATSVVDLASQLRPGVDGLVLRCGRAAGTFLPAVWDQLPDPLDFVVRLQVKAGLAPGSWAAAMRAFRYETEEFGSGSGIPRSSSSGLA